MFATTSQIVQFVIDCFVSGAVQVQSQTRTIVQASTVPSRQDHIGENDQPLRNRLCNTENEEQFGCPLVPHIQRRHMGLQLFHRALQ